MSGSFILLNCCFGKVDYIYTSHLTHIYMKQLFILFIAIFAFANCYAGSINYQPNLSVALKKAKETGKPLFVTITPPAIVVKKLPSTTLFKNAFEDDAVADFYNKSFVNIKFSFTDSAYKAFKLMYPVRLNTYPVYIFLDSEGEPFYRGLGVTTPIAKTYLDMGNEALRLLALGKTPGYFKRKQQNGKLSQNELKEYITARQQLSLFGNSNLIDEYVNNLTIQSLNNYNEVLFILRSGPIAYGKTYSLCYTNRKIIDSIYKTESLEIRREINNHIIANTRNEAIRKRDNMMAQQLSNFVRSSWSKDYNRGNKAATEELLYYYSAIKDTLNYYRQAVWFYDTNYMKVSVDSIKKLKEIVQNDMYQTMLKHTKELNPNARVTEGPKPGSVKVTGRKPVIMGSPSITIPAADVPAVLNNAAYTFYTLGTRNPEYLTKALLWVKRAMELAPTNAQYDTMAHILYRLGLVDEAILNQKKAIELARTEKTIHDDNYVPNLKKELVKMQERKL